MSRVRPSTDMILSAISSIDDEDLLSLSDAISKERLFRMARDGHFTSKACTCEYDQTACVDCTNSYTVRYHDSECLTHCAVLIDPIKCPFCYR